MGRGLQLISARVEKPSTTITAVTMNTGDANTVRNTEFQNPIRLLTLWAGAKAGGLVRIRSSLLHDAVNGIRLRFDKENPEELLPEYSNQILQPQDLLTIEATGPAGGGEWTTLSALIEYDNIPGAAAQLVTWPQIADNVEHLMGVETNLESSGTVGQYGTENAINAAFDNFRVNRYYAILGYTCDAVGTSVTVQGVDFGNFKLGGPAHVRKHITANWFVDLAVRENAPRIPVFNSANRAGVLCGVTSFEASKAINVTFILALLKSYQPV